MTQNDASTQLSSFCFVLVRPQLSENIGTSLRALWNCGFEDLRLVCPKKPWPDEKGVRASAGACEKAGQVRTYDSLPEALQDCQDVVAATVRPRELCKPVFSLEKVPLSCFESGKTAFVFGPERSGLSSEDVSLARKILTIDLNPLYGSLNLAQSVLLIAHMVRGRVFKSVSHETSVLNLACYKDLLGFSKQLEVFLDETGYFFPPEMGARMARNLRNMMTRMPLTSQEVRSLRGAVSHLSGLFKGNRTSKKTNS